MDDLQYKEHKLAKKARRITKLRKEVRRWEVQKEKLNQNKPSCDKDELTYEESIEFGKRMDQYEEELKKIELGKLKTERQLSALQLQVQKLLPVSGIKIKASIYTDEGDPLQTYHIRQSEQKDKENKHIEIEECRA